MGRSINIRENFLTTHFFQIKAGLEHGAKNELTSQGHKLLYKSLGQYDVISFLQARSLHDSEIYTLCNGIQASRSVVACNIQTNEYESPNINSWINNSPLLGFYFLELDKWLYAPEAGESSSIEACITLINTIKDKANEKKIDVSLFVGLGRSELYAIVRTKKIDDIWAFTTLCRNMTFEKCIHDYKPKDKDLPVFFRTHTIPCFSYDTIRKLDNGKIEIFDIKGKCKAYISVKCPSGFENYLKEYFSTESKYTVSGVLGSNDVIIATKKAITTAELLSDIVFFRSNWEKDKIVPVTTSTCIIDPNKENDKTLVKSYSIDNTTLDIKIPGILFEKNSRLANRIKSFINNLNSFYSNKMYQSCLHQLVRYMDYIQDLLDYYEQSYNDKEKLQYEQYTNETDLLEAIETAELGLTQRVDGNFDSVYITSSLPPIFGEGIFSSLVAIEYLINHIFTTWSLTQYNIPRICTGFPVFSDSIGFQVRRGETIFLPIEAIYNAATHAGNWLTLTHEISHAIYLRLEIEHNHKTKFKDTVKNSYPKSQENKSEKDIDQLCGQAFDEWNELFAHWFDYYHFFNADLNEYLNNIWRSWLKLPVVHKNLSEYFFRSFIISIMDDYPSMITTLVLDRETRIKLVRSKWESHLQKLQELNIQLPKDKLDSIILDTDNYLRLLFIHMPILSIYYNEYRNDQFREKINWQYLGLDNHLNQIKNGQIVLEKIDNPYALIKQWILDCYNGSSLSPSVALILAFKNQMIFYAEDEEDK